MNDDANNVVADAKSVVETRLATLRGFKAAAEEEMKAAGGIDPELKLEMRRLDDAIRALNIQKYLAQGRKIQKGRVERERCPTCQRRLPAHVTNLIGDEFSEENEK